MTMTNSAVTISRCFTRQLELTPDAIALAGSHTRLSYRELNRCANHLALRLLDAGVQPGERVLVCLPRSLEAVVAFLAVLKAGAAYVPLEPSYPEALKKEHLDASGARHVILASGELATWRGDPGLALIDSDALLAVRHIDVADVDVAPNADMPAYVMFTSGSMGRPKGVVVAHRGVVRLVRDTNYIRIDSGDVLLLLSNIGFDASTFEIWGALLNGARLVVYEARTFDPNLLSQLMASEKVSVLWLTAALFHLIARRYLKVFAGLRVLLAGGDVLRAVAVNAVLDAFPALTVINGYGPTENTTFTCCHSMTGSNRPGLDVPIGLAIRGTQVHILDAQLQPVADGEEGELCASGLGVALGYLNAPEATRNAFVERADGAGLLYRTGDLVRRAPDGLIAYIGRRDRVAKVRGFRVSLDEVQSTIARIAGIEENIVQIGLDTNNEKCLEAFIQTQNQRQDMVAFIRGELRKVIPPFMIPDTFTICAQLPLNANGKVDRKLVFNNA